MFNRFTIVESYYWWLSEHYDGQWSREYARLCKLTRYFRPSPMARGPLGDALDGYRTLCDRAGCHHEPREDGLTKSDLQ